MRRALACLLLGCPPPEPNDPWGGSHRRGPSDPLLELHPKGADWADGLPRGRGASAAPAPLAAAGECLGVHVAFRGLSVEWPTTEPLLMFLDLDGD